ncbi:MAG: anti-sigma factor [Alcaligenaceae bacterium]|nr:anti-sigma factor [Alcaligenaceae bacterium]
MSHTTTPNDALLAEYTLGLLNARETQQAHALLAQDDDAVATALDWEERFLALTDLLAPVDPSPLVLQRIQTTLGHDTTPPPSALYRKVAGTPGRPESAAQAPGSNRPPEPRGAASTAGAGTAAAPAVSSAAASSAAASSGTAAAASASPAAAATAPAAAASMASPAATAPRAGASPAHASTAPASTPGAGPAPNAGPASPAPEPPQAARGAGNARPAGKGGNIWFWRLSTVVFAGIALVLGLAPAKPSAPPVTILEVAPTQAAVLQAPGQSSTPAWVLTIDHQQNVHMMPQVNTDVPPDASVQLWTHTAGMPQPRSLGLIDPNRPVTVPAELLGSVSVGQIFEMTLEPQGGSRSADPSGPVLYIGRVVALGAAPAAVNTPPR